MTWSTDSLDSTLRFLSEAMDEDMKYSTTENWFARVGKEILFWDRGPYYILGLPMQPKITKFDINCFVFILINVSVFHGIIVL